MNSKKRIMKLENKAELKVASGLPTSILTCVVKPISDGTPAEPGEPILAWILVGQNDEKVELWRSEDEPVEEFELRVNNVVKRIYDGKPNSNAVPIGL